MTLTLGWWLIPAIITIFCVYKIYRTNGITGSSSMSGVGSAIEGLIMVAWFVPALLAWVIYFGLVALIK